MAIEPQHSETMSGAPASSEPADFGANAALILAALGRIETVVRDERAALASLRASLGEMAQAIARAKAVADSENAAAMLDEFEHRVDAMIGIAGGTPETEAPATESIPESPTESNQVPTVSGVVLRLGPGDAAPEPAAVETEPPAETVGDKGPTVAMLTAMVEALSASIQTPAQEPEAEVTAAALEAMESPPPAMEMAPEFAAAPVEAEVTATVMSETAPVAEAEPVAEVEPLAEAVPALLPSTTLAQESTLLASFEQMESRPFPPPEEGTAVIFTSKFEPEAKVEAEPEANVQAEYFAPEPAPTPEPDQPSPMEAAEFLPPAEPAAAEVQPEPVHAAAPEPADIANVVAATAEPEAIAPPAEAPAESKLAEAEFDPADFLFGPEPEPDPAAFLLDTAPPRRAPRAVVLPQPEFVATPSEPPQAEEPKVSEPGAEPPQAEVPQEAMATEVDQAQPTPEPAPHDPLRALKAMSANERLAIFS
jgi:hypothetical protein